MIIVFFVQHTPMNHSFSCKTRIPYKPALFQYLQVVIKGRNLCHMLTIAIIDLLCFRNFNVCAKNDDRGNQQTFPIIARDVKIESLMFIHNSKCIEMRFIRFSSIFCNDKHITFFNKSSRMKNYQNPSKGSICNLNAVKYKNTGAVASNHI